MAKRKTAQYVAAVERNHRRYNSEEEKRKREEREAESIAKEERRRATSMLKSARKVIKKDIAEYYSELYKSFSEYKYGIILRVIDLYAARDWKQVYYNIYVNYSDFQEAWDLLIQSNYQGIKEPLLDVDTRSESYEAFEKIKFIIQKNLVISWDVLEKIRTGGIE